jgi:hypothetical protein
MPPFAARGDANGRANNWIRKVDYCDDWWFKTMLFVLSDVCLKTAALAEMQLLLIAAQRRLVQPTMIVAKLL